MPILHREPLKTYVERETAASASLVERSPETKGMVKRSSVYFSVNWVGLIIFIVLLIATCVIVFFVWKKKKKARKAAFKPQIGVIQPAASSSGQTGIFSNISNKMPFGKGAGTHHPNESASNVALISQSQYPPQSYAPPESHGHSEGYAEHKPYDPPPSGYMMPPPAAGSGFGQGPQPNSGQPQQGGHVGGAVA